MYLSATVFTLHESTAVKTLLGGGVAVFDAVCAGLLELRGSGLGLLKSTFGAENFLRRLSWSISSHFVAI